MAILVRKRPDDVEIARLKRRREAFRGPPERRVELRQFVVHHKDARPKWSVSWIDMSYLPDWDDGGRQHYILNFLYWRWLATAALATVWAQRASLRREAASTAPGLIELKVSQTTLPR